MEILDFVPLWERTLMSDSMLLVITCKSVFACRIVRAFLTKRLASYENGKLLYHDIPDIRDYWQDDSVGFLSPYRRLWPP